MWHIVIVSCLAVLMDVREALSQGPRPQQQSRHAWFIAVDITSSAGTKAVIRLNTATTKDVVVEMHQDSMSVDLLAAAYLSAMRLDSLYRSPSPVVLVIPMGTGIRRVSEDRRNAMQLLAAALSRAAENEVAGIRGRAVRVELR